MDSLTANIVEFIDVLRTAGVRLSISESMDAVEALKHVDIINRSEVKAALSACLAKSEEERRLFSEAFDVFFIPKQDRKEYVNKTVQVIEQKKQEIIDEASRLKFQGEEIDLSNEQKMTFSGLSEDEKQSIIDFLNKTSSGKNVGPEFKPIAQNIVHGKLNSLRERKNIHEDAGVMQELFEFVPSEAGIIARDVIDAVQEDNNLLYKNIEGIKDEDIPRVIRLIRQIVDKLKRKALRKFKRTNRKARLDLKKTIKSNLSTGTALFRLKYKKRPRKKEKFLILCDVSASMYRFSGFVLQLITEMHSKAVCDSYAFSEEAEHLSLRDFVNAADFERQIKSSPVWRKGTNISRALTYILKERQSAINSSTIVLVVSDAKTLEAEKTAENLKVLESRVKRVIWLNPIPEKDWERIAGADSFRKYCTMLDCSTLERLSKACGILA